MQFEEHISYSDWCLNPIQYIKSMYLWEMEWVR